MEKVIILMTSYNGDEFIEKQIRSIQKQTFDNWHLYIQDDGSSDNTLNIVEEMARKDSRITLLENHGSVHGAFANFHVLSNKIKKREIHGDYYMFSDQDDVWYENKLEIFLREAKKHNEKKPLLFYADMELIDENDSVFEESINKLWKIDEKNKYSVFFSHKVFGCNSFFNDSLFYSVPPINEDSFWIKKMSHDNLYTKYAAILGNFYFVDQVTMGYRRHSGNVTEEQDYHPGFQKIMNRVLNLNTLAKKHAVVYSQSLVEIEMLKRKKLSSSQKRVLNEIQSVIKKSGFGPLKFIKSKRIVFGKTVENASHKIILFLGLHKKYLSMKGAGRIIQTQK